MPETPEFSEEKISKTPQRPQGVDAKNIGEAMGEEAGKPQQKETPQQAAARKELLDIAEQSKKYSLAPSMVDRQFNAIFGKYTGEAIPEIYRRYIEPLSDDVAKEAAKLVLLYSDMHPEVFREIGEKEARGNLVRMANGISEEAKKSGTPISTEYLVQQVRRELDELQKAARERIKSGEVRVEESVEETPSEEARNQKIDEIQTAAQNPAKQVSRHREKSPEGLDYFPGLPKFTDFLRHTDDHYNFSLIKKEADPARVTTDEEIYDVYVGQENVGRFTVRRHGNMVERNVFLTYKSGEMVSIGEGGTVFQDSWRQIKEKTEILSKKFLRK